MASKRTPYEMAEEILGLAQELVLELGGSDGGPPGKESEPALDLRDSVEEAVSAEAPAAEDSRRLVGSSWAPRSWS